MGTKERIKKIQEEVQILEPYPVVRICRNESEVAKARKEFIEIKKLNPEKRCRIVRIIKKEMGKKEK